MITPVMMYWIVMLDNIRETVGVLGIAIPVVMLVALIVTYGMFHDEEDTMPDMVYKALNYMWHAAWLYVLLFVTIFLSAMFLTFMPGTKQLLVIYGVPKIINSDFVQKQLPADAELIYKTAKEYLIKKELK